MRRNRGCQAHRVWRNTHPCCRYLLEDGKLNLCLRLLEEYTEVAAEVTSGKKKVTVRRRCCFCIPQVPLLTRTRLPACHNPSIRLHTRSR